MQLSKLEIKGFKSFGDRVVVNFDKGITGVVGPNGCGKSNIVDAIRWVLGEQKTRALRSEKMENVIFNGTKKRKALQMAEVSMTFNNTRNILPTEYAQVTITRRYYRSGDSEYLLNGVTCRLKDITDLFLDTGIGPDSYAIIELKMVDDILNDTNNSRRSLFEEAAGISKFKIRKKQTMRKLEDTDKDLERVADLLYEIEKNLKSLEKQASQAEKYLSIKEEYKSLSVQLARASIQRFREASDSIKKQLEEQQDHKTKLNSETDAAEAAIEKLKAGRIEQEKLLSSRQKTLNEHISKIRQYESDKKIRNERLRFLKDKSVTLQEQLSLDKQNNERAFQDISRLNEEKASAEKILDEIAVQVEALQKEYDEQKSATGKLQEELSVINNNYRQEQDQLYQLKKSLEVNEVQLNSLKSDLEKTSTDSREQTNLIEENSSRLKLLAEQLEEKNNELEQLRHDEVALNQKIEDTEKNISEVRERLSRINRETDSKENEYNLTKSLVDNLEGFPEAIKFLRKNSRWGKEAPLLSDLLTCDDSYRIAIENYLEQYMNYYVVENPAEAYQAINLLHDSSKGKANFFITSTLKDTAITPTKSIENCVPAIDIVEYDERYAQLIRFILDDVYIIVNENENVPEGRDEIFITKSGKFTRRRHTLAGGSVGLFEGKKIGRVKNLEKLSKKIKTLNKEKDQVKNELDRLQNDLIKYKQALPKQAIETKRSEITQLNEEYIGVKMKKEQLESIITKNSTRKEDIQQNIHILEEGIKSSKPKLELKSTELEGMLDKINQISDEVSYQNEQLNQKSNAYNQENIRLHQQRNRIQSTEQEITYKENTLENTRQRIEKNTEDLQKNEQEIKKLFDTTEVSDDELLSMYEEKEKIEAGVNEAERSYYHTRGEIDEAEKSARELHRRREQTDQLILELQNKLNETKLSLSSVQERLSVEFDVRVDQLMIEAPEDEEAVSEAELRTKVEAVKSKLDKMGPVNPMAVEAYEEIKKRHEFITGQQKDLDDAKSSLLETITEIDTVAKENFLNTFEEVNTNFQRVFRSLFTAEDSCELRLSDKEHPLDAKIEIIARPKGKKPLSINQLSGGEKTLTAVALLFSIYLIKPAPFCIFDEVDAPLDDANIDKFNNIIREFSQESQFILVTHNKRTMSMTDIIYGVTMQETGVSKLVPVDLRELENEHE